MEGRCALCGRGPGVDQLFCAGLTIGVAAATTSWKCLKSSLYHGYKGGLRSERSSGRCERGTRSTKFYLSADPLRSNIPAAACSTPDAARVSRPGGLSLRSEQSDAELGGDYGRHRHDHGPRRPDRWLHYSTTTAPAASDKWSGPSRCS